MQSAKEIFVEGLTRSIDGTDYDRRLSPDWVAFLSRVFAPLRFPVHGMQMVAAYFGHIAPSGRIAVTSLMQAADEMRRIQTIAYRMRQLQETHPTFGTRSKDSWQDDPAWQPLRELVERLLVTYDWGEALVALNLVVKPAFDEHFVKRLGELAQKRGDDTLAKILYSLGEDCAWHRQWTDALVEMTVDHNSANRAVIDQWVASWRPKATRAMAALEPAFGA
jgi:toluene monooxygenase system protein E